MKEIPASIPSQLLAWQRLDAHALSMHTVSLKTLFSGSADRCKDFSLRHQSILLDYSKNHVTRETLKLLYELADACDLRGQIEALFSGAVINNTEARAALHTALRQQDDTPVLVAGEDVIPGIRAGQRRMRVVSEAIRSGHYRSAGGKQISDVVHIGIGGSHLGPQLVCEALRPTAAPLRMHFVSNIDGHAISATLNTLAAESTLFIVASKSFTTQETLGNALTAKSWLQQGLGHPDQAGHHFIAVTSNPAAARQFGIEKDHIFEFQDWVGGRFSLWSAIGLPIALLLGMDSYEELLAGAAAMDQHFRQAPFNANMPVILALIGIWYNNFLGHHTHAIVPYDSRLLYLPAYLQQLEMESNGKGVDRGGRPLKIDSAPIIWGGTGTDSQHAFFQLLHQGTRKTAVDFLLALQPAHGLKQQHRLLVANCLAQSEALMSGRSAEELHTEGRDDTVDRHRVCPGNRPSNTLLFDQLTPYTLGSLIALYEHKVFVQGVIWNINSFDQWGVELGKQLTTRILAELDDPAIATGHDASTNTLLDCYRRGSVSGDGP